MTTNTPESFEQMALRIADKSENYSEEEGLWLFNTRQLLDFAARIKEELAKQQPAGFEEWWRLDEPAGRLYYKEACKAAYAAGAQASDAIVKELEAMLHDRETLKWELEAEIAKLKDGGEPVGEVRCDDDYTYAHLFVDNLAWGTKLFLHPQPIPEGFVQVPKEPTILMESAGKCAVIETKKVTGSESAIVDAVYREMINAAPTAGKKNKSVLVCSVCHAPQYNTPSGVCCRNGHGGAEGVIDAAEGEGK